MNGAGTAKNSRSLSGNLLLSLPGYFEICGKFGKWVRFDFLQRGLYSDAYSPNHTVLF